MKNLLESIPSPVLFVGIGNPLKGDDGVGPVIAQKLLEENLNAPVVNCGDVPENYLRDISSRGAKSIVFIDAVVMGEKAGTVKLFPADELSGCGASTHGMPLYMLSEFLKNETGAAVYLLGIQPGRVKLGEKLSQEAEKAVQYVIEQLGEYLKNSPH